MRQTKYADEIATASVLLGDTHEGRLERLLIKGTRKVEIRFSWWKAGRMLTRPLDLPEESLLELLASAIQKDVLSPTFITRLREITAECPAP